MKKTNKNIKTKGTKKGPKKIKRAKNTTKTKRAGIKKGGLFIKKGTYGSVYSKPRMLCQGETIDTQGINSEVSKIFEDDDAAISEITNTNKLNSLGLPDLEKYAIIPKKICDIDRNSLNETPYNTEKWKQNKNGQYNSSVLNDTIDVPTEIRVTDDKEEFIGYIKAYNKLIISDEGGDDLYEIIKKIQNYDDFKSFLQKLTSIGKGIQLLQNNGLIHGDIKVENCIEHEDTFKIIDLSDVRNIKTTKNPAAMPIAFGYNIWPITAFYTYLFHKGVVFKNMNDINMIITEEQIEENYTKKKVFNDDARIYLFEFFSNAFKIHGGVGYTPTQIEKIAKIRNTLQSQKIVKYDQLERIIIHFNKIFTNAFNDIDEFKMDLFKRIDIYSFGIMILYCIKQYLNSARNPTRNESVNEKIVKLYEIVFDCCYQKERVADINIIIETYKDIVNSM
jgi:serine/threonine protein kinase